ncbi:hypothetical protein [Sinomonas mesophila]|uniref:hypothetical protein n=1 Tax=Sinomonas mesophila TaxID=1531955 RepID=UPI000986D3AA|nr:hypothetical protein [Sinomonas mesophila]
MNAYSVACTLKLSSTPDEGLKVPMPAPTPSLLLVVSHLDPEADQTELQIGAMISGPAALAPGTAVSAQLSFWDDLGRIYATPGTDFKLWYDGRIVGFGTVESYVPET